MPLREEEPWQGLARGPRPEGDREGRRLARDQPGRSGSSTTGLALDLFEINSGAPGKQGAGVDKSKDGAAALGVKNPVLIDESGEVGKLYGATNTPHMFVIDPSGVLVYAGAIDNSPDAEGESPEGGTLVNYVTEALAAIDEKRPVKVASTKAYGCSVKY